MDINSRPSGIEGLGDLPLGIHFCLFYETGQHLLETLIPYFKPGLANNEFHFWVVSHDRTSGEASTLKNHHNAIGEGI